MKPSVLYTIIITAVFLCLAAVFLLFPRSTYSELEKRDLATFPEFTPEKLRGAQYTTELSTWFSDTEPFRDRFMSASMKVRDMLRFSFGDDEETVSFHSTASAPGADGGPADGGIGEMSDYENKVNADDNAKIASAGILIIGKAPCVRTLNAFGGTASGGTAFASAVSEYAAEMPGVNVYAMVIPLSSEFYLPDKAKKSSNPQLPTIKNIYAHLGNGARGVNAYGALAAHVNEEIYLRTDHHWAPLGAYYAAKEFASAARVPFKDLSAYEKHTVRNFVGSMYGYSKDASVKNSPEDFVYYVPKGVSYDVTYRNYKVNKNYQVTSESAPAKGKFFYHYPDGNGGAYSTFMGGDQRLTHVHTGTRNGRRLVIIKDSYGNAVPGYLFHSFEDIYVVDFRYFTRNIRKFVADNKVTDILFCVNIFNAYSASVPQKLKRFLTQGDNSFAAPTPEEKKPEADKSKPTETPSDSKKGSPAEEPKSDPAASAEPAPQPAKEEAPESPALSGPEKTSEPVSPAQ